METADLRQAFDLIRNALDSLGIPYAVGGSWASGVYGEPRYADDLDLVADLDVHRVRLLVRSLGCAFCTGDDDPADAVREARPFHILYLPLVYRFHFYPVSERPPGTTEIDRARWVDAPSLSSRPIPVISPEDVVVAKLDWFRQGGEVQHQHWRDIAGILRGEAGRLDRAYLDSEAACLGLAALWQRAAAEAGLP